MNFPKLLGPAALAALSALAQPPGGAANQIIQVPAGWSRADVGAATVLNPDAAKNSVQVVLEGFPFTGDLRARFNQEFLRPLQGQRILNAGQVQTGRTSQGIDMLSSTAEVQLADRSHSFRYYVAAAAPGSFEVLIYMANSADLFLRYTPDVGKLIATRRFANAATSSADPGLPGNAPPPPGSAPPAGAGARTDRLEGVYSGFKFNLVTTIGAVVQRSVRSDFFSFFPDGTVYNGLPDHGLVGFNMARECAGKQDFCGVYQVNNGQISIVLNRGTYRQAGTLTPGVIQIADRRYVLQGDPAKTSTHALEGVFLRADARPGEDLARKFIQFTRDGRFQDQGLVKTVAGTDISTGNLRFERDGGAGTYRLANFTLILHYSDGYERGLPILIRPEDEDQPAPSQLYVNTYTLVRRN